MCISTCYESVEKHVLPSIHMYYNIFLRFSKYLIKKILKHKYHIKIYVDWNDTSMPRITSKITAAKIKEKIKEMKFFLILGTHNAMTSVWVPWETGVADQCKKNDQIFIIPVADNSGKFYGNEYFQLYRRIELDSLGNLMIVVPKQPLNEAITFSEYFRDKIRNGLL